MTKQYRLKEFKTGHNFVDAVRRMFGAFHLRALLLIGRVLHTLGYVIVLLAYGANWFCYWLHLVFLKCEVRMILAVLAWGQDSVAHFSQQVGKYTTVLWLEMIQKPAVWNDTEAVVTSIVQIEAWYLEGANILLKSSCIPILSQIRPKLSWWEHFKVYYTRANFWFEMIQRPLWPP